MAADPQADSIDDCAQAAMLCFDRWLEADERERAELLAQLSASRPDVHARLAELIAADSAAERARFLESNALSEVAPSGDEEVALHDLVGKRFGAWQLERLLGVGGAGQVWLAQRCDGLHEGKSAVKLLRTAAIDAPAQRRFAREGRLLARLEHPNIARLLDVGDDAEGQRFLVLEYSDGERIDTFCDGRRATIEARLRLFLQVCDAVAYAHANLIVHRDLKPSNILVQADGTAKLLDFGVAKLLDSDDESYEMTDLTRAGGAAFTPEYAAPEQFENQAITVATDVYSLAVVLYGLLAGRRPHGGNHATPAQLARAIRDGEPRRVSFADATQDMRQIAHARSSTPEQLRRTLRGDLDTILAKALKRNPSERYASVQALAGDVRRYLDRMPILARADSNLYRARKFVARNRLGVAFASVMLLILVTAGGMLAAQARRLKAEVALATTIKNFLLETFLSADAYHTSGEPAGDIVAMLKGGVSRIENDPSVDPGTRAETFATAAHIFRNLGRYREAQQSYRKAGDIYRRIYGERSPKALDMEAGEIANDEQHGNLDGLMPRIDRLLANIPRDGDDDSRQIRWGALNNKAFTALALGDFATARAATELRLAEMHAAGADRIYDYTMGPWCLAQIALDAGVPTEADRLMRTVIEADRKLVTPLHPGLFTDLHTAIDVLIDYGAYADAEPIAAAVLEQRLREYGRRHRQIADAYYRTAMLADQLGHDAQAEHDFAAAIAIASETYVPHAQELARIRYAFGIYLLKRERLDAADTQFVDCVHGFDESPSGWHWRRAACAAGSAYCAAHHADGRAAAIATLDRLIGEERAHHGRELPTALWLRARLAAEHLAADTPQQQLAWLDEGALLLGQAGRGASRIGGDIEYARRALGAPPASAPPKRGRELVQAASGIVAAARAQ